jgi:glycosyltransferase involved in cell wall biosynthesis
VDPHILFLDHTGTLGGAELYLLDIARSYRSTASVVLFEDGPFRRRLQENGVETEVVSAAEHLDDVEKESSIFHALRAVPDIWSLARRIRPHAAASDLVFANSAKALFVGGLAGAWTGTPVVWSLHDMLTEEHFSLLHRRATSHWANGFADRVLANSNATRKAFVTAGGDPNQTSVVYNGVDVSRFSAASETARDDVCENLDIDPRTDLVGLFSRIAEWKGQDVMIRALPDLPEVHLLVVGEALFEGDEAYKRSIQTLSRRLGVADRVHFLGFRDDVPRLMTAADVVVHTSTAPEPFGRVIVEGMLAGTPVIATEAGGAAEIIDAGETGVLLPPNDAGALRDAVEHVLCSDGGGTAQMVRQARREAQHRYSVETMIEAVDDEIRDVLQA